MRLLLPLFLLTLGSCTARESDKKDKPPRLDDKKLTEASGLAVSRRDPSLLWVINDGGSPAKIHLTRTDGKNRGSMKLRKEKNNDWEDLAAFTLDGKPYLLVADVGDNNAKRKKVELHVVAEPKSDPNDSLDLSVKPDWSIRFRYEDGPRDCEAVAVDAKGGHILLVTKREKHPGIYQLPLARPSSKETLTAKRLGPLAKLKLPPGAKLHLHHFQPTGLDISADGTMAAVLTYRGSYLFRRSENESWAEAFAKSPEILGAHGLSQAEALAFSADGRTLFITSEGKNPRLISIPIPAAK